MKPTHVTLLLTAALVVPHASVFNAARGQDPRGPLAKFASRQALNDHYRDLFRTLERQQIADLAALAEHETGAAADDVYRDLFHQAIARGLNVEAFPAADRYLARASTSAEIRSLALLVSTGTLIEQGQFDRALDRLRAFLKEQDRPAAGENENHHGAIVGAGDQLAQRLMRMGRYDLARMLCAVFIAEVHDREVSAHFENLLRPLTLVGKPAAAIDGTDVDGMPFDPAALKGKVVFLVFWATWCPPCLADLPRLNALAAKYEGQGFEVLGVNVDGLHEVLKDAPATLHSVRRVLVQQGVTWPNLYLEKGKETLTRAFAVETIPTNFLIGRDGTIVGFNLADPALDPAIAKALGGPSR